jgi:hypothetical protein
VIRPSHDANDVFLDIDAGTRSEKMDCMKRLKHKTEQIGRSLLQKQIHIP